MNSAVKLLMTVIGNPATRMAFVIQYYTYLFAPLTPKHGLVNLLVYSIMV